VTSLRTLPEDLRIFAKYHLQRRVYDYPAVENELGIVDLGFEANAFAAAMRGIAGRYQVETLAEVPYRGGRYPIVCASSPPVAGGRTLVVLGGVHGNEHAGILAVPALLERCDPPGVRLVAVAPVNPVGAAHLSRYNADGFDINRDFVRFETAEARAVRSLIERERPDFVVSLHEGPQDGTFMFLNRHVDRGLAQRLARSVAAAGTALATRDYFGRALDPAGVAAKSRAVVLLEKLWAAALQMKATGAWCEDCGIPEITLESSWRGADGAARIRPHVALVETLVAELASG